MISIFTICDYDSQHSTNTIFSTDTVGQEVRLMRPLLFIVFSASARTQGYPIKVWGGLIRTVATACRLIWLIAATHRRLDRAVATLPGHDTTDPTVSPSDTSVVADAAATTEKGHRPERVTRAPLAPECRLIRHGC
ncbi:jg5279 [Pararge aegeria aegeria]|uniref:Jg5279 protein n=1 Tax=Pararge aegeria aegeria TaxID=348720 RepID=A0A8S4RCR8_9NEOP|nr:jg5279 [Pararge aegeria aegeria]